MSKLREERKEGFTKKYFGLSYNKFFLILGAVIASGIYIGVLLYGTNSWGVLQNLNGYEIYLTKEIKNLKNENANLQREYFELKEIGTN